MSSLKVELCSHIVTELLGKEVGAMIKTLCASKSSSIRDLHEFPVKMRILNVLYQHGFAKVEENRFQINLDRILLCLRYPRYLYVAKNLIGNEAELLTEEILLEGQLTSARGLIKKAMKRLPAGDMKGAAEKQGANKLIKALYALERQGFLNPVFKPLETPDTAAAAENEEQAASSSSSSNWLNVTEESVMDSERRVVSDVGVGLNFDRFHVEFQKQVIIASATRRIDASAGCLMKLVLDELSSTGRPSLSSVQILSLVKSHGNPLSSEEVRLLKQYPEQYIRVLEEDETRFLARVGDEGGGTYAVNTKALFSHFAAAVVENIVMEKFSSKALRIFRLIVGKKFVEESQIQGLVMIPSKEAKLLTYQLLEDNFLQLQELKKSINGNAPSKSFYLFHVDLNIVSRMCLEMCFKSLVNIYKRQTYERKSHSRLLEKQERVESIAANLTESNPAATKEELQMQLAEVQDMISPPERELIKKVHKLLDSLSLALAQVDDTSFILETFVSSI